MDKAGEKQKLENEQAAIEAYLNHPFTRKILADNEEQQNEFLGLVINAEVHDLGSFFALLEARGHLRGLRRTKAAMTEGLDEIKEKLKEL